MWVNLQKFHRLSELLDTQVIVFFWANYVYYSNFTESLKYGSHY